MHTSLANVSPGFRASLLMALLSSGLIPDDLNKCITVRGLLKSRKASITSLAKISLLMLVS